MADRVVKVTLTAAVGQYVAEFDKARTATEKVKTEAEKAVEAHRRQTEAMKSVGAGALAMGTVVAAGLAYVAKTTADFDASMSQVQSLSHATSADMTLLRDAALSAGQGIGMTASQVADAEIELVKAGVSVKDQLGGGLVGTLNLAAAGQMNVADATQIAASAMTQFKLSGKDVPHIADLLAAGADKALGSVSDLGQGLKYVGPVAQSMGVSIDQTVGSLAMLAQNGILGEQAGTSLRGMMLSLTSPSKIAAKTMGDLGISVYDAQGKFVGLNGVAEQLHDKLGGLDEATRNQALGQIFGNEQITTATVLMQGGAKAVDEWTKSVNEQGFASEQAAGKMDNLNGDLSKLQAAFESSVIKSGGGMNDVLRDVVQNTTGLVTAVGGLPAPVLEAGVQVAGLVAGAALLGGGFLLLLPKIASVRAAMQDLNLTGMSVGKTFGKGGLITLGLMAASGAAASFGRSAALTSAQMSDLNKAVDSGNIKQLDKQFEDVNISSSGFADTMKRLYSDDLTQTGAAAVAVNGALDTLSFGLTSMSKRADESRAKFSEMGRQLADTAKSDYPRATTEFNRYVKALGGGKENVKLALSAFGDYRTALEEMGKEQGHQLTYAELLEAAQGKGAYAAQFSAAQQKKNAAVLSQLSGKAHDATGSLGKLVDALNQVGSAALDVSGAQIAFHQAIDDATASIEKNGQTLDLNTQAGRDNQSALDQIAASAIRVVSAQAEAGASSTDLQASMQTGRDAFVAAATAILGNADAANELADKYHLIPADVSTAITATGADDAAAKAGNVRDQVNSIPVSMSAQIDIPGADDSAAKAGMVRDYVNLIPTYHSTNVTTPGAAESAGKADSVTSALGRIPLGVTSTVNATDNASGIIRGVQDMLAGIPRFVDVVIRTLTSTGNAEPGIGRMNGGIVDYYARGGIRENHVAEIAPAGAWRVWAEPETGGEAYIPLAASKRQRSLAIWEATGARLGVQGFADGGVTYVQVPVAGTSGVGSAAIVSAISRLQAEVAALNGALDRPNLTVNNPIARDVKSDAWEAANLIGAV